MRMASIKMCPMVAIIPLVRVGEREGDREGEREGEKEGVKESGGQVQ